MTKLEEYKIAKAQLEAIKALTKIDITQVDYPEGGKVAQFILSGVNVTPQIMSIIVNYMITKQTQIIAAIKADQKLIVNALLADAKAEAITTASIGTEV